MDRGLTTSSVARIQALLGFVVLALFAPTLYPSVLISNSATAQELEVPDDDPSGMQQQVISLTWVLRFITHRTAMSRYCSPYVF